MVDRPMRSLDSRRRLATRTHRSDRGNALLVVVAAAAILFVTAAAVIGVVVFQQTQQARAQAIERATGLAQQGMDVFMAALREEPGYNERVRFLSGRGEDGTWTVAVTATTTVTSVGRDSRTGLYHVIRATLIKGSFPVYQLLSGSDLVIGSEDESVDKVKIAGKVMANGSVTLNQTFNGLSVQYYTGDVRDGSGDATAAVRALDRISFEEPAAKLPDLYSAAIQRGSAQPLAFYRDPANPNRNYWMSSAEKQTDRYIQDNLANSTGNQVDLAGVGVDLNGTDVFYVRSVWSPAVTGGNAAQPAPTRQQYKAFSRTDPVWNNSQNRLTAGTSRSYEIKPVTLKPDINNVIYVGGDYDVYVKGEYSRSLTIVSEGDIYIVGSITRKDTADAANATLGLVAKGDIYICGAMPTGQQPGVPYAFPGGATNKYVGGTYDRGVQDNPSDPYGKSFGLRMDPEVTVQAALLSVGGSISMDATSSQTWRQKLTIRGSMAALEGFSGRNFVSNETDELGTGGFASVDIGPDVAQDGTDKLEQNPPPAFPQMGAGAMTIDTWEEYDSVTDPNVNPYDSDPTATEAKFYTPRTPRPAGEQTATDLFSSSGNLAVRPNVDSGTFFPFTGVITLEVTGPGSGVSTVWYRYFSNLLGKWIESAEDPTLDPDTIQLSARPNSVETYTVEYGASDGRGNTPGGTATYYVRGSDTETPTTTVVDASTGRQLPNGYPASNEPVYNVYGPFTPVFTAVDTPEGWGVSEIVVSQINDPLSLLSPESREPDVVQSSDPRPAGADLRAPLVYTLPPVKRTLSGPITRRFVYYAIDAAGNREPDKTFTVVQHGSDQTPPRTLHDLKPVYFSGAVISLTGEDDEEGMGWQDLTYVLDSGAPVTTTENPRVLRVTGAGTHTLSFSSRDSAPATNPLDPHPGNHESTQTFTFTIHPFDLNHDSVPVTSSDATSTYYGPAVISLTASDTIGIKATYYMIDDVQRIYDGSRITIAPPESGPEEHTITFWSEDWAGISEYDERKHAHFTVNPENTPPTTTAHNLPLYGWPGTARFLLAAKDDEGGSGVAQTHYRVNDGEWREVLSVGETQVTVSGEGTYTVQFHSVDLKGNSEGTKDCTFVIDTTSPVTSATVAASYIGQARIPLTATDAGGAGVRNVYWLNVATGFVYESDPTSASVRLGAGTWDIRYWSVDKAGNEEYPHKSLRVDVAQTESDDTEPDSYAVIRPYYNQADAEAEVDPSRPDLTRPYLYSWDTETGVRYMHYRINGGTTETVAGVGNPPLGYPVPWTQDSTRTDTIEYWAEDVRGNVESQHHFATYMFDTQPPVTTSPGLTDGRVYWDDVIDISLTATDTGSGARAPFYILDGIGSGQQAGSGIVPVPAPTDGAKVQHRIEYWSVDNAGNAEVKKNRTFWAMPADEEAPRTSIVSSTTVDDLVTLNLLSSDGPLSGPSGVKEIRYTINGVATVVPFEAGGNESEPRATSVPFHGEGSYRFEYWAVDRAGRTEGSKVATVVIDSTPPMTSAPGLRNYFTSTAVIDLVPVDTVSGVAATYYKVGSGATMSGTRITVAAPASGTTSHTIEYWSVDRSGNTEPHITKTFRIDTEAPHTSSDVLETYAGAAAITFTAVDDAGGSGVAASGTKYKYQKVGSAAMPVASGTSLNIAAPAVGHDDYNLWYWSVDNAGNAETTHTAAFAVASVANMTFSEHVPAPSATVYVRNPNLSVKATDNTGSRIIGAEATVDGIRRPVTLTPAPGYWTQGQTVEWYPDEDCVEYCPDDEDCWNWYSVVVGSGTPVWVPENPAIMTATFSAEGLSNGSHNVKVTFTNVAGQAKTAPWAFTVTAPEDKTAPVTTSDAQSYYKGAAVIKLTAADEVGGMGLAATNFRLDDVAYAGTAPTTTVTVATQGRHTLEYWSTDRATPANREATKTVSFWVDWTPPTTIGGFTSSYVGTATIFLAASDNSGGSGLKTTNYTVNGGAAVVSGYGVAVTGGTQTTVGGNTIITFTSSGTLTCAGSIPNASVLVVGGGGGGASGGGGAGGLISRTIDLTGSMPVVVGAGGAAGGPNLGAAANGGNSTLGSLTAIGGGGGLSTWANGRAGGSGGGGGASSGNITLGGAGTFGQGFGGGGNGGIMGAPYSAGGGGGAGGLGMSASAVNRSGAGGPGIMSSITGTAVGYAGGGGGGIYGAGGFGGTASHGGGAGLGPSNNGAAGTVNTGGGGGGGGSATLGGQGGSGIVVISFPTPVMPAAAPTNLVGQWHLDEGTGANVADASGRGGTGTLIVGPTGSQTNLTHAWTGGTAGRFGKSVSLDGASDYVDLGSNVLLSGLGDSFSVSAWVKTSENAAQQVIAGRGADWRLEKINGEYVFEHRNAADNVVTARAANSSTDWVNVVGTFDAAAGEVKLYLNGVLADTEAQTGTTRKASVENHIGNTHRDGATYGEYGFRGQIDEVTLWSSTLAPGEVQSYYGIATNTGVPPLQFNVAPPASGPPANRTIRYWSTDRAGNTEAESSATISISRPADRTPPTTTSTVQATYVRPTPIVLTATDNGGGWGVADTYSKLDGAATVAGTSPSSGLEGTHTMEFWSVDSAGNKEATRTITYRVLADTTPPVTGHNAVSKVGTATVTLTPTDAGWGVTGMYYMGPATTRYSVDDGAWMTGTVVTVAPPVGDAVAHHIDFYSVDAAGNKETTKTTGAFNVEGVQANITWSNVTPAIGAMIKTTGPTISITGQAPSAISSIQAKVDGATYNAPITWISGNTKASTTFATSGLPSGSHTVEVTFRLADGSRATYRDTVNNRAWTFSTDVLAPTTTSNAVASYPSTASITLTATDNFGGSGVKQTYYMIDDVGTRQEFGTTSLTTGGSGAGGDLGGAYVKIYTSANNVNWTLRATLTGASLGPWGNLMTGTGTWNCPGYTDKYVAVHFGGTYYAGGYCYGDYGCWDCEETSDYCSEWVDGSASGMLVTAAGGGQGALAPSTWTFALNGQMSGWFNSMSVTGIRYSNTVSGGTLYTPGTNITVDPPVYGTAAHHIEYWSEDNLGNLEQVTAANTKSFTVAAAPDSIAPTSTSNAAATYAAPGTITFTATDNPGGWGIASIRYALDGAATQTITAAATTNVPFVTSIPTGGSGPHTLRFWAVDRNGNVENTVNVASYTVASDTTKPHTTTNIVPKYTGVANITLTPTDPGGWGVPAGGTAYRLYTAGVPGAITSGTALTIPETIPGPVNYTLQYWSVDRAGNKEDTETASFSVWATEPPMTWTGIAPADGSFLMPNGPTVSVTGRSSLDITAAIMSIDGIQRSATLTRPTTTQQGAPVLDHYEEWWSCACDESCWDSCGDTSCSEAYSWQEPIYRYETITVVDPKAATLTFNSNGLSTGLHTVTATYTVAGGRQAIKTWTFTVDNVAPTTYSNVTTNYVGVAPITLTAVDNVGYPAGAGVKTTYYKLDGSSTYSVCTSTIVVNAPVSGSQQRQIWFYSNDKSNPANTETPAKTATFTVSATDDTAPPWTTHVPDPWPVFHSAPATVTISGQDNPGGWGVGYLEYKVDNGTTQTVNEGSVSAPISSGTEGRHSVTWFVKDRKGNRSPNETLTWITDRTAPVTTMVTTQTAFTGPAAISLNATDTPAAGAGVSSGVATTHYSLNGGATQAYTGSFTIPAPASGSAVAYAIRYWSVDAAGNTESAKGPFNITVAPALARVTWTGQTPTGSKPTRNWPVSVTGEATAAITSASAWLDGNPVTPATSYVVNPTKLTATFNTTNLSDGAHTVRFRYVVAGQGQAEATWTFTIEAPENQPPVTTDNRQASYNGTATITLTPTDYPLVGGSGVAVTKYALDGAVGTGRTITVPAPVYGSAVSHWITYYSADSLCNTETVRGPYYFTVAPAADTIAPTTNSNAAATYVGNGTITLTPSDNAGGTGVAKTYYKYGDAATVYQGLSIALTAPAYGFEDRHVHYWSTDRRLPTPNTEAEVTKYFRISAPPEYVAPTSTDNAQTLYPAPWTITINATDNFGGWGMGSIDYRLDEGTTQTVSGATATIGTGGEGSHTLRYLAVDRFGNRELVKTVRYYVDMTDPTTTSDRLPTYFGHADITLTATDTANGSGVASTWYTVDGGATAIEYTGTPVLVNGPTTGTPKPHTLTFWSVDRAGRDEDPVTVSFTISMPADGVPPTTTATVLPFYPGASTIALSATDNVGGWGVDKTYYAIDDSAFAQGTSAPTGGNQGVHHIDYYSTDLANNAETPVKTATYTVDVTPPTTISDTKPTYSGVAVITLTPTDNVGGSGVKSTSYTVDDGTEQSGTSITVPAPSSGFQVHHIDFRSTDNMDHPESWVRANFIVSAPDDTAAPLTTSNATATYSMPATITLTASDIGWGLKNIRYSLDNAPMVTGWSTAIGGTMMASVQVGTGGGGLHSLKFQATDQFNITEPMREVTYTVTPDVTPPVTECNAIPWYEGNASIRLDASDTGWGVAGTFYRLDGGQPQSGTQISVPEVVPQSLVHVLEYWSLDRAGNKEATRTATFTVASMPANASVYSMVPTQSATVTSATTTVSWKVHSNGGQNITSIVAAYDGVAKTVTNSIVATAATSSFTVPTGTNGLHSVDVTVTVVGGRQVVKHWTFTANVRSDFEAPTTTPSEPIKPVYYGGPVRITLVPVDNPNPGGVGVKGTYYLLDNASVPTSGTVIDVSAEGTHTLRYWSVDRLDSKEATKSATFRIDQEDHEPPLTTCDAHAAYNAPSMFFLNASDSGSKVEYTWYRQDGGEWFRGTSPGTLTSPEGTHTIEFYSIDFAGNRETTRTKSYLYDTQPPVTTSDAQTTYEGRARINFTVASHPGGIAGVRTFYKLDGMPPVQSDWLEIASPPTHSDEHTLEYWSEDVAGNKETTHTIDITVEAVPDDTEPDTWVEGGEKPTYDVPGLIKLSARDDGWGLNGTFYKLDGGPTTAGTSLGTGAAGGHTLLYWSVDLATNNETTHTYNYTVLANDTNPPHTVADCAPNHEFTSGNATIKLTASDDSLAPCTTYYQVDGGQMMTGTDVVVVAPASGTATHTVTYWSVDINGVSESPHDLPIRIVSKATNMVAGGVFPADGQTINYRNPLVTITASGAETRVVSASITVAGVPRDTTFVENGVNQGTAQARAAYLADGVHMATATFQDALGQSWSHSWYFTVAAPADSVPPTTTTDATPYYRGDAVVRLFSSDNEGGMGLDSVSYKVNNGTQRTVLPPSPATAVTTTTITITDSGAFTIEYWSVDNAANVEWRNGSTSLHKVINILIDRIAPSTTSNRADSYDGVPAVIRLTPTDNSGGSGVATTYYVLDSGAPATGATVTVQPPATGEQEHTLSYWSVDRAGNVEPTKTVEPFIIYAPAGGSSPMLTGSSAPSLQKPVEQQTTTASTDTVAPTTSSDAPVEFVGPGQIRLTATDAAGGSGVAHTYYTYDDGVRTESTLIGVAGSGTHHIDFWSVDAAGNKEETRTATFTIVAPDLTPPTTTAYVNGAALDSEASFAGTITVTLEPADDAAGDGVQSTFYFVGAGATSEGRTIQIRPPAAVAEKVTITYWSVDRNDNREAEKSITFWMNPVTDALPPTSSIQGPTGSYSGTATISIAAVDNEGGSGYSHTHYRLDDAAEATGTTVVVTPPEFGQSAALHHIDYYSVDNAGNVEGPAKRYEFTVATAPMGVLSFRAPRAGHVHLSVLSASGVVVASREATGAAGELAWDVRVPAGQSYTMRRDQFWVGSTDYGIASNVVQGVLAGRTYAWSY